MKPRLALVALTAALSVGCSSTPNPPQLYEGPLGSLERDLGETNRELVTIIGNVTKNNHSKSEKTRRRPITFEYSLPIKLLNTEIVYTDSYDDNSSHGDTLTIKYLDKGEVMCTFRYLEPLFHYNVSRIIMRSEDAESERMCLFILSAFQQPKNDSNSQPE